MTSTTTLMCNNATLAVYVPSAANPWNEQKINHLYRRAGFGATRAMINDALTKTPEQVVNQIINVAKNATPTPAPYWANWNANQFGDTTIKGSVAVREWKDQIIADFYENRGGLNDRLTLFWSNHLVASTQGYFAPPQFYKYYNLLQRKGIGNFKELVYDVGITGAMLLYLNGFENKKNSPNENYARELLELFTLGVNNGYTQQDIVEVARALTGWNDRSDRFGDISFNINKFDQGNKTFFGKTGNWGYDDVIDILFEERELKIARYICRKMYAYFVSPSVNETIVNQLANTFKNNNFDIAPVLARLFKSEHFFDESVSSVIIKSPIDLEVSLKREMNLQFPSGFPLNIKTRNSISIQAQDLFGHVTVAGWDGDQAWINPSTLVSKWDEVSRRLQKAWQHDKVQYKTFLNSMLGSVSNDVGFVTQSILDFFFSNQSIDAITYQGALVAFKDNVPQNYFDDGSWNTNWDESSRQMFRLMQYIIRIPEFQLK